ncbi:chromosome segregation protein SMC [Bacillus sp. CDB3]|uniref:chromosome segregation protein SMC n=1 Tax=Bacillus sp. CDB3 TaxID=360310 RepID=UPI0009D7C951|nr:chromosome segregation protein SMC [Bacillus sp. CDB3]OQR57948.1 chromosome segregation protein SMC [Bacillus sp. CDB3]
MTENEKKLIEQIYDKVVSMEKKVDKLDGRMVNLDIKLTSVESKMDDLKNVHTGLQATFEKGFADVRKGLSEIIEINKNRKSAREIVEGIAGNGK